MGGWGGGLEEGSGLRRAMLVRDLLPDLGRDLLPRSAVPLEAAPPGKLESRLSEPRLSSFTGFTGDDAFRIGDEGPVPTPPPTRLAASNASVTLSSTLRRFMLLRDLLATRPPPEAAPAPSRAGPPPCRRASSCTADLPCCISCILSCVSPVASPDRGRHASALPPALPPALLLEAEPPRRRWSAPSSCGAKGGASTCITIGPSASGGMLRVAARWPGLRGRVRPMPTASDAECLS